MKQICQLGFNCPFLNRNDDGEICTYPHIYFWEYDNIRINMHPEFLGFDVETLREHEWIDSYMYVEDGDCPLIEPGSEIDPVMWYDSDRIPKRDCMNCIHVGLRDDAFGARSSFCTLFPRYETHGKRGQRCNQHRGLWDGDEGALDTSFADSRDHEKESME